MLLSCSKEWDHSVASEEWRHGRSVTWHKLPCSWYPVVYWYWYITRTSPSPPLTLCTQRVWTSFVFPPIVPDFIVFRHSGNTICLWLLLSLSLSRTNPRLPPHTFVSLIKDLILSRKADAFTRWFILTCFEILLFYIYWISICVKYELYTVSSRIRRQKPCTRRLHWSQAARWREWGE